MFDTPVKYEGDSVDLTWILAKAEIYIPRELMKGTFIFSSLHMLNRLVH